MAARNAASDSPSSMLLTTSGALLRGSITAQVTPEKAQDSSATSTSSSTNSSAGSGSLLPTRSIQSSARCRRVGAAGAVATLAFITQKPGGSEPRLSIRPRDERVTKARALRRRTRNRCNTDLASAAREQRLAPQPALRGWYQ
jgi:hypothetical protein